MLELNKIYNEDCLEGMKQLDDNSIDLIVTDPPYGIKRDKQPMGRGGGIAIHNKYSEFNWDNKIPPKEYFIEMLRVSKNQIIFGGNYMAHLLLPSSCWLVWDKKGNMPSIDFADCELAWTSFNKPSRIIKHLWRGMLQENMYNKEKRYHPTQKPVGLFKKILKDYSNDDDLILDPFIGSGTTAVACQKTNRNYIGFEISKEYCDIANKRLKNDCKKLEMFE